MPQRRKPNQFARVLAVLALVGAVALVVATVATNEGSGEDDKDAKKAGQTGETPEGRRAVDDGVWVVQEGDTLVSISEETGVDLDQLVELNADIDPQVLITGQRIALRPGQAGQDDESTTTSGDDPADEFGDGSVDGGDSSGTSTSP